VLSCTIKTDDATPLFIASRYGREEPVAALLAAEANVNQTGVSHASPRCMILARFAALGCGCEGLIS
jgi:hypothetical protein